MYKFLKTKKMTKTLVSKWGEVPLTCAEGMGGKGAENNREDGADIAAHCG